MKKAIEKLIDRDDELQEQISKGQKDLTKVDILVSELQQFTKDLETAKAP